MAVSYLKYGVGSFLLLFAITACSDDPVGGTTRCNIPNLEKENSRRTTRARATHLYATTADHNFSAGTLSVLDLDSLETQVNQEVVSSDSIVRAPLGSEVLYVVNRFKSDNIQVIDRQNLETICQFSVGRQSNPQDILLHNGFAYVSRNNETELLKYSLDPVQIQTGISIDRDAWVDRDGRPEMSWMISKGDRLFLMLQRMYYSKKSKFPVPEKPGLVLEIDMKTDQVVAEIPLVGKNPNTDFKVGPDGGLYVATVGAWGKADAGIEKLGSRSILVHEKHLGGEVLDFEVVGLDKIVAIVVANSTTKLLLVDASDTENIKVTELDKVEAFSSVSYTGLIYDPHRKTIWIADRQKTNPAGGEARPGVIALDSETMRFSRELWRSVGLPPYRLILSR